MEFHAAAQEREARWVQRYLLQHNAPPFARQSMPAWGGGALQLAPLHTVMLNAGIGRPTLQRRLATRTPNKPGQQAALGVAAYSEDFLSAEGQLPGESSLRRASPGAGRRG
jgi:hypothetical protein